MDGVLLLNKPSGVTSNRALQTVKRLLNAQKAGHTGSLDPAATGMLPLCFGEATKVCAYLLEADKSYRVTAKLGIATDTGDADGEQTGTAALPNLSAALDTSEAQPLSIRLAATTRIRPGCALFTLISCQDRDNLAATATAELIFC